MQKAVFAGEFVKLRRPAQGILEFNLASGKVNALSIEVMEEVREATYFAYHDKESEVVFLPFSSAGAYLPEILALETYQQALDYAWFGQDIICGLERVKKYLVSAVPKFALGGGCELSMLPADFRFIAYWENKDNDREDLPFCHSKIGLPEANLGIRPGWGGTVRFAEVLDNKTHADALIATGVVFDKCPGWSANECYALRIGLVDGVIEQGVFYERALKVAKSLVDSSDLEAQFRYFRRQERLKDKERSELFRKEREKFAHLAITDEAKEKIQAVLDKSKKRGGAK